MPVSMSLDAYLAGLKLFGISLGNQFNPSRALVSMPGVAKLTWIRIPQSVKVDAEALAQCQALK